MEEAAARQSTEGSRPHDSVVEAVGSRPMDSDYAYHGPEAKRLISLMLDRR